MTLYLSMQRKFSRTGALLPRSLGQSSLQRVCIMSPDKVAILPYARSRPVRLQKSSSEYRNKCIS
jgi:hypothetical protein